MTAPLPPDRLRAMARAIDPVHRRFTFDLQLTVAQDATLRGWAGTVRYIYNLALEQRRDWWRQYQRSTGKRIGYFSQSAELTMLRAEFPWVADCPSAAQSAALRDLELAFSAFFKGAGYPTPRRRGQNDGLRLRGPDTPYRRLNAKWGAVRIPKLGWVKFRQSREIIGEPKTVTLSLVNGSWSVSICTAIELPAATPLSGQVGIDRGVAATLSLSNGEQFQIPAALVAVNRKRRRAQRVLARRKRGSHRREKARARVAALHARARRIRTDWSHRVSTDISRRFGLVAVEALKIKNMTASAAGTVEEPGKGVAQKRGLNRSILAQSWGQFERFLAYKLEAAGGTLIRVNPAYTSQTCSACGTVDARSRKSQAVFECVHCGHADNADVNAAKEILRRSTAPHLVEGPPTRPVETRTTGRAA